MKRRSKHGGWYRSPNDLAAYNAMQASAYWSAIAGGQCTECGAQADGARCSDCRARRKLRPSRQAAYRAARGDT